MVYECLHFNVQFGVYAITSRKTRYEKYLHACVSLAILLPFLSSYHITLTYFLKCFCSTLAPFPHLSLPFLYFHLPIFYSSSVSSPACPPVRFQLGACLCNSAYTLSLSKGGKNPSWWFLKHTDKCYPDTCDTKAMISWRRSSVFQMY